MHDVLCKYGLNANRVHSYRARLLPGITRLAPAEIYGIDDKVTVPVRLDPSFRWETTQLVNRMVALWGEIPAAFLLSCAQRRHAYGYVGLTDRTMFPILHPGALVMIDPERRRVSRDGWKSEFDRPIYFIELREGYRCAWCQVEDSRLTLIPHPKSSAPVQTFSLVSEANVVGEVVGVAMRLVPPNSSRSGLGSKPPVQSELVK